MPQYELAVGAMFKNESDSILEWIAHYVHHGVQHFYLVNDSSTDNTVELIQPHIESGLVTLYNSQCPYFLGRQRVQYNQYILPHVRNRDMQWLIIVDMDEYVWSQRDLDLKVVFRECNDLAQIQFNHTLYGSNGHLVQPAGGLVRNFTRRSSERPTVFAKNYKYAVNSDFEFTSLNIHHANAADEAHMDAQYFLMIGEPYLLMNHYSVQSLDFWNRVKCTRGDGDHYLERSMDHFQIYDVNEVEDLELWEQNQELVNLHPILSDVDSISNQDKSIQDGH